MSDPVLRYVKSRASVHFIGIGGVGMAGLARLLHQSGHRVSGSDNARSPRVDALVEQGITCVSGHRIQNLGSGTDSPAWAVRTPAVDEDNPEVRALRARGIPVFSRGQVLAALANSRTTVAVAGAHGKTTTSAMLAHLLRATGVDCGYAVGGDTALPGNIADCGTADPFVIEADESDGTLALYRPETGMVTCIEWDHVERFPTLDSLLRVYYRFTGNCKHLWIREGDALSEKICADHPRVYRAGTGSGADAQLIEAENDADGQRVEARIFSDRLSFHLPLPGIHNAWNALMALAAAVQQGCDLSTLIPAMASFPGVARRFDRLTVSGITLVHDYAHHPTELAAVLDSCRALSPRNIWLVFEPHRYSRTRHLLNEFAQILGTVDHLALLPVYAASELPEQGADSRTLADECRKSGTDLVCWKTMQEGVEAWASRLQSGDLVLMAGAGSIEGMKDLFANRLAEG